jgi:hypothetical protein
MLGAWLMHLLVIWVWCMVDALVDGTSVHIDGSLYDAWTGPRIIKGITDHGILDAILLRS